MGETLRHNPLNEVTGTVERVVGGDGSHAVRKVLRAPAPAAAGAVDADGPGPWAASADPRHWNYWRREVEVYRNEGLRDDLRRCGLDLAACTVEERADGAVLRMEDVEGTPGTAFTLDDHVALAAAVGRWQAGGPLRAPWASSGFLRAYSLSRPVPWHLLDDDAAWAHPLVADLWPPGLRAGWARLVAHRSLLLDVMERLPRTRCHLDLWVANAIRRPGGPFVLLDWAFTGDGAVGEDLGNYLPDAVFDLFWPAERLPELEERCFAAHLDGLVDGGWAADARDVRLGVVAASVKYAWLLPLLLARAPDAEHRAYHRVVGPEHLYRERGLALARLVSWCDEALALV